MKLAVIWHRLGPYHVARLRALSKLIDTYAIEMSGEDCTYAWDKVSGSDSFKRVTIFPKCDCDSLPRALVAKELSEALEKIKPDIVAIPSWGECYSIAALQWCLSTGTNNLVMTDSNEYDKTRVGWKEYIKRRLVRYYQAGLVSSTDHRTYLEHLGMLRARVFYGYNVVDNAHFSTGASNARKNSDAVRQELKLPQNYFMCSARFVEKKNLFRLFDGFAYYTKKTETPWHMVLIGDGKLRPALVEYAMKLGISEMVSMPGFKQYNELPKYYALAKAFILPSTEEQWGNVINEAMSCGLPIIISRRCGSALTLVHEGVNGYMFDPYDTVALGELMLSYSSGGVNLSEFGLASSKIIEDWSPSTFAANMLKAVECSLSEKPKKAKLLDRLLMRALVFAR